MNTTEWYVLPAAIVCLAALVIIAMIVAEWVL
jgi:hypothetical protein